MPAPFKTTRRVEFRDTDAAGIVHFSAFFPLMEQAEHELLRALGTSVVTHDELGTLSWPRAAVSCDYVGTAKFEDILEIQVCVARLGTKSVTYDFSFYRGAEPIARGRMTAVYCRIEGHQPRSLPVPDWLKQRLADYMCSEVSEPSQAT